MRVSLGEIYWLTTNATHGLRCVYLLFIPIESEAVRAVLVRPVSFRSHELPLMQSVLFSGRLCGAAVPECAPGHRRDAPRIAVFPAAIRSEERMRIGGTSWI